jgi:uncharacterized membrane protein (DUF2068 family)
METHLNETDRAHSKGLWLIGIFKIFKSSLLIILALGTLSLVNRDLVAVANRILGILHIDPENNYVHEALVKLALFDPHTLRKIGAGTIFYACMMMTEGIGLVMRKRWAEWFTIIATCSFIPLELYEIVRHSNKAKVGILCINLAVVAYLIYALEDKRGKPSVKKADPK